MKPPPASIVPFADEADLRAAGRLFGDYAASLGVDLSYQGFDAELAGLPGKYAPPGGQILLARAAAQAVGCVAMRPMDATGDCEMKRLYVSPDARGQDLGRRLALAIIDCARAAGYRRMCLDTLGPMRAAQALYGSLGFRRIAPYYESPVPGTIYLALDL